MYLLQASHSMSLIPKVVSIFFIAVAIFGVISYLRVNAEYRRNMKSPVITQRAKLLSKQVEVKGHKNPDKDPKLNPTASIYHVMRFRLQTGQLVEFDVKEEEYNRYHEGQIGQLASQGTWFKDFQPEVVVTRGKEIAGNQSG